MTKEAKGHVTGVIVFALAGHYDPGAAFAVLGYLVVAMIHVRLTSS